MTIADEVNEAMEMIGAREPRQIITEISGFYPLFEAVLEYYNDLITAAVFGIRWRYCQLSDGVCRAKLDTIAEELKIDRVTVLRHTEKLVADGYLTDLTPDLKNKPHRYADGGKVVMKSQLSTVAQRNVTVAQSHLNKVLNKDIEEKREIDNDDAKIFTALSELTGGGLNSNTGKFVDAWKERHTTDWILRAVGIARENGARAVAYVDKILIGWEANGYPQSRDEQVKARRGNGSKPPHTSQTDDERQAVLRRVAENAFGRR